MEVIVVTIVILKLNRLGFERHKKLRYWQKRTYNIRSHSVLEKSGRQFSVLQANLTAETLPVKTANHI